MPRARKPHRRRSGRGKGTRSRAQAPPKKKEQTQPPIGATPLPPPSRRRKRFAIGTIIGLILGAPTAIVFYTSAAPGVLPPTIDRESPLVPPFTVANDHILYTLRNVRPICVIRSIETDRNIKLGGLQVEDSRDLGPIPPGERRAARCKVPDLIGPGSGRITSAALDFVVKYEIQWLPGFRIQHEKRRIFEYVGAGAGFWTDVPLRSPTELAPCEPKIILRHQHLTPTPKEHTPSAAPPSSPFIYTSPAG